MNMESMQQIIQAELDKYCRVWGGVLKDRLAEHITQALVAKGYGCRLPPREHHKDCILRGFLEHEQSFLSPCVVRSAEAKTL
jgi:hypothetical protein